MSKSLNTEKRVGAPIHQQNGRNASRSFWATVFFLAAVTMVMTAVGRFHPADTPSLQPVELPQTVIEMLLSDTAIAAKEIVAPDIDALLDSVYGPSYAAIPEYATFHYSVLGEYIELTEAVIGQMSEGLHDRLFDGFEQRLADAVSHLDQRYVEAYHSILQEQISNLLTKEGTSLPLGEVTDAVLQDAVARVKTTLPLATVTAGIVGSGSLKAISATIATKLAAKIAAKASAKGVIKGGSVFAGAGGGALLCSWSGPGAVVCGAVGGTIAWLLTDAIVVNIDEYFNRDEFESDLQAILDEDRAEKRDLLAAALEEKAAVMDEIFTMRDLSSGN